MTEQILQSAIMVSVALVIVVGNSGDPKPWIKIAILTPLIISIVVILVTGMMLIWQ